LVSVSTNVLELNAKVKLTSRAGEAEVYW
jgi:hypothetical protein